MSLEGQRRDREERAVRVGNVVIEAWTFEV